MSGERATFYVKTTTVRASLTLAFWRADPGEDCVRVWVAAERDAVLEWRPVRELLLGQNYDYEGEPSVCTLARGPRTNSSRAWVTAERERILEWWPVRQSVVRFRTAMERSVIVRKSFGEQVRRKLRKQWR